MPLFGISRKQESNTSAPKGAPTDMVLQMRQQGISNNQIVQNLQRQGFSANDIFDAMNQADIKGGVEAAPTDAFNPTDIENNMKFGAPQGTGGPIQHGSQIGFPPMGAPPSMGSPQQPSSNSQELTPEYVEEIVEAVIDERWTEIIDNIRKVIEWKNAMDQDLVKMKQQIVSLNSQFDELHKAVVGKIGEYDQNILNVGTEIKAMERVFEKVLPAFTENVKELNRITEDLKQKVETEEVKKKKKPAF